MSNDLNKYLSDNNVKPKTLFVTLTEEEASTLCREGVDLVYANPLEKDYVKYRTAFKTPWMQDEGWQKMEVIFQLEGNPEYYRLKARKSGSDFTYWYYEYDLTCPEVKKKERIVYYYE